MILQINSTLKLATGLSDTATTRQQQIIGYIGDVCMHQQAVDTDLIRGCEWDWQDDFGGVCHKCTKAEVGGCKPWYLLRS